MIKLSDYVIKFISGLDVKYIFLLPGGGCMHLVDSLGKNRNLRYVCCLHEQAAGISAQAYAEYTNNIGVTLVTTGPGGTNAITAVAGAWIDSIPLLIISGQVKRSDMIRLSKVRQKGIQEVDIVSIVKPITKYAVTIFKPSDIRHQLEKAVYLARTGRPGPVWIDIPLDVQGAMIDEDQLREFKPLKPTSPKDNKNLSIVIDKTIRLFNNSQRPAIIAGNGIRLAKALDEFLRLADYLTVPILTTWKSIDFLSDEHALFFGRPGSIGQRGANFVQQNADFIMALGARLDLAQIGYNYKNFARRAKKIIVDIDPAELRKINTKIEIPVCLDVKFFIRELMKKKDKIALKDRSAWLLRCQEWKRRYPVILPEYHRQRRYVNTYVLIDILSELMSRNDILVPGSSGGCSEITLQAFKVKKGQRIINSPGLGSMGFGLPASIGACLASGKKRTVTIIGDGGLQHNIQELETVRRLNLPLKIFILNNNGYGSIRNTQKNYFKGNYVCCGPSSGLTFPDTSKIAKAYGIKNTKISDSVNIKKEVKKILETKGPIICDVITNPSLVTAPRLSSETRPDGSIVSKPIEDLWPFLDREEFKTNMIVTPIEE